MIKDNAKELYTWMTSCPVDYIILDMENAEKIGTVSVVFDLVSPEHWRKYQKVVKTNDK
jgi:hypothetical protein